MRRRRRRYGREHGRSSKISRIQRRRRRTKELSAPRRIGEVWWRLLVKPCGEGTWLHQKYPPDFSHFAWCTYSLCAAPAAPDSGYFPTNAHVLVRSGACGAAFFPVVLKNPIDEKVR
eukprot:gene21600-biopygen23644